MNAGFIEVGNSSMKGDGERRALGYSPEPGRRGPTPPDGGVGVGPKLLDAPCGRRKGGVGSGPSSLDSYERNCNRWSRSRTLTGPIEIDGREFRAYKRLKCKSWDCVQCGPAKAFKLRKAIGEQARKHDLTRLLTLTLDPKRVPQGVDEIRYIRNIWRKFRVYLKRKFGESISYILILEFHESGRPHLHVLVNRYLRQSWVSGSWEALGGGRICHIERVFDIHRIAHYLSDYLTKTMILSAPAGTRRYSTSRDVRLFEKAPATGWQLLDRSIDALRRLANFAVFEEDFDQDGSLRSFKSQIRVELFD